MRVKDGLARLCCPRCRTELKVMVEEKKGSYAEMVRNNTEEGSWVRKMTWFEFRIDGF